MNSKQRLALVVAALAVAVIAFVVLNPSNDDDGNSDNTNAVATAPTENAPDEAVSDTTPAETETAPAKPPVTRIAISGGKVDGGAPTIKVTKGDPVRIVITSDAPDELHLHGYDVTKEADAGKPARFVLKANLEGVFELESHTAEDAGLPAAVAKLVVEPS
jgi:FtsP/CotA-like multicopper oxidase with cupredoxin domain